MTSPEDGDDSHRSSQGAIVRPPVWLPPDRHIVVGVSHPSDDPARHRVFEVRASFDAPRGGWLARVGEQNLNEQREDWGPRMSDDADAAAFPTAAACLGAAVETIVTMVDREALPPSSTSRQTSGGG